MKNKLTIGKLAKASEVNVETIRFYERRGLLKKPSTLQGSFRVYPEDYILKIRFIKKAQELGFTLNEIKDLLTLDQDIKSTCGQVSQKAQHKIQEVQSKIKSLKKMELSLKKIVSACKRGPQDKACCRVSDCFENRC